LLPMRELQAPAALSNHWQHTHNEQESFGIKEH
jgi:hypothetical protein